MVAAGHWWQPHVNGQPYPDKPHLYFWRTSTGIEVDLLVEDGDRLVPIEVKLSATPKPSMAAGIRALRGDLGDRIAPGFVIHPGTIRLPLGDGITALPFGEL
jgi:predicted AAA+ superfamily ATPase